MRRRVLAGLLLSGSLAALGCGGGSPTDGGGVDVPPAGTARTTPTQGSAVAVSADDRVAVAANRGANAIAVFNLSLAGTPATASRTALLPTGPDSDPWAVVLGNDGDTAFAILRRSAQAIRITGLRGTPAIAPQRASTGAEPTGLAISPTGRRLYVANWAEGTVTVINTADMSIASTVDLNAALAASPVLGTNITSRAGLAHPRALVVTNNGDGSDDDETVYATEFFSQARAAGVPADDSAFDVGRQGVVYRFNAGSGMVAPGLIYLAPTANTGFQDSTGTATGCFPNQLYAAAINRGRVYISGLCESPRGPTGPVVAMDGTVDGRNFKTELHAAVYVVDTATNAEVPAQSTLLTQRFQALYDGAMVPDDATRRMPLIPNDIAFAAASNIAYVTAYGSDAVFRVVYGDDGAVQSVGSSTQRFINLAPGGMDGRLPTGIAPANVAGFAVVINEFTRNLSLVSFATQSVVGVAPSADPATGAEATAASGRHFFATGLGRWSLRGQGWNSCEGCHPDGLTDNVTWFFARGPRQTTSLDGSYSPDGTARRFYNWSAIFDETHDFENNTRGNSGGVGAVVHANSTPPVNADRIIFDGAAPTAGQMPTATNQSGLNGAVTSMMPGGPTMPNSALDNWNDIDAYLKTIRAPRAPTNLPPTDVAAGRALFEANNCGACHGTNMWTISRVFYTPNEANNAAMGLLRSTRYTLPPNFPTALNPPAAMAMGTAPLRFTNADPMVVAGNDQINCALRAVGTFPGMLDMTQTGVAPTGVRVREVRTNMTTPAQGATGFNPPALVGMATGAPYFHAGNARTLEEAFDAAFNAHAQALSSNFLAMGDRTTQVRQMVAFLLSIDETTAPVAPMTGLAYNPVLCPDRL